MTSTGRRRRGEWPSHVVAAAARAVHNPAPMSGAQDLAELPNLGPKSQAMLAHAGITTLAQLRRLGAVRAYVQVKRAEPRASLNLLWALQSLLTGRPWQDVARDDRLGLLLELAAIERGEDRAHAARRV
jgi:DNA transformation protein and related proteins